MNTKRYKIVGWSINDIISGTNKSDVSNLQLIVTSIIGTLAATTWYETNATYGMVVGLLGIVLDKIVIGGLTIEES